MNDCQSLHRGSIPRIPASIQKMYIIRNGGCSVNVARFSVKELVAVQVCSVTHSVFL